MSPYVRSAIAGGLQGGVAALVLEVADIVISDFIDILLCFAFMACGFLAARHFAMSQGRAITGGEGVGLGALAGAVGGFLTAAGISIMILSGFGPGQEEINEAIAATGTMEGPAAKAVEFVITYIHVVILVTITAMGSVLGLIGGALGWRVWRPRSEE